MRMKIYFFGPRDRRNLLNNHLTPLGDHPWLNVKSAETAVLKSLMELMEVCSGRCFFQLEYQSLKNMSSCLVNLLLFLLSCFVSKFIWPNLTSLFSASLARPFSSDLARPGRCYSGQSAPEGQQASSAPRPTWSSEAPAPLLWHLTRRSGDDFQQNVKEGRTSTSQKD